jgi:hypothetical protein
VGFIAVLSTFLVAGCASSSDSAKAAAQTPYGLLLQDAASYIGGLKDQGKLPGFQKGEHGSVSSIPELLSKEGAVTFPVSVVLRATKKGTDTFYRYTILKSNSEAPWKMIEATSWDKDGNVIEQLLPK